MGSDTIPARVLLGATNLCASSHDAVPLIDKDTTRWGRYPHTYDLFANWLFPIDKDNLTEKDRHGQTRTDKDRQGQTRTDKDKKGQIGK